MSNVALGRTKEMNRNTKEITLYLGSVILMFLIIAPLLLAAVCYAVPAADDFSNANAILAKSDNILKSAIMLTGDEYFNWQGTFMATFLLYAWSPLLRGGVVGIRISCALITGLYLVSLYFLSYEVFKHIFKEERLYVINYIYSISILFFTIGKVGEAFYWFCGGMIHTLPLAFCLLGSGFMIKVLTIKKNKKRNVLLSMLCMMISAGGSLQVAAAGNVIALGVLIYYWKKKEVRTTIMPIFLSVFLTALLNAGAPGNFVRHSVVDEQYHIQKAVWWATQSVMKNVSFFLMETPIILLLIFLIAFGKRYGKKILLSAQELLMITVYIGVGTVGIDFPVILGYSTIEMPERCCFIEKSIIVLALMYLALLMGIVLSRYDGRELLKDNYKLIFVGIIAVYILGWTSKLTIQDYTSFNILINYKEGNLKEFKEGYEEVFSALQNGKDSDVEIEYLPDSLQIFRSIGIKEDPTDWVNQSVARYYDCNSVFLSAEE